MEIKRIKDMAKKIMFCDKYGLTRAVIEGRKTQTRRVISGLPSNVEGIELITLVISHREYDEMKRMLAVHTTDHLGKLLNIPYQVGQEVAVAQSYKDIHDGVTDEFEYTDRIITALGYDNMFQVRNYEAGWKNKLFVRADLMRYRVKMTNGRVERLQDISDEDCMKEGIGKRGDTPLEFFVYGEADILFDTPQRAFASLIDKVSGKGTWESNPWVFVYDFELVR